MKTKKSLIIWGATGQLIVLEEFLREQYKICAVFDNDENILSPFDNIPIFHKEAGFDKWHSRAIGHYSFIVAIGGSRGKDRERMSNFLIKNNLCPISAINKKSFIAKNVKLGKGIQVMMGACIATRCIIGDNVIVNTSASIDHECIIANGCHIGPGAKLAGKITVGEYSFIGIGAVILPNLKIGKECIIGAGSVVTKDIPDYSVVYGNPARIKGKTND